MDSDRAIVPALLTSADDAVRNAELDFVLLAQGSVVQHSVPALEDVSQLQGTMGLQSSGLRREEFPGDMFRACIVP